MAAVLGISGLYHDAAAALVVDGRVVAAIQEERLSRLKNDPSLPRRAMAACLRLGGLESAQLDAVIFYENPFAKLERVLIWLLRSYPRSVRHFARALGAQLGSKLWVLDQLAEMLSIERTRVRFVDHHRAHAASAFYVSPFAEAAVLTVDGVGEDVTTAIYRASGTGLERLSALHYPHSLGLLYAALTAYLGFEVNEGEHQVMALAAFGTPRYREEFAKLIRLHDDGSFELTARYFNYEAGGELGFSRALEVLLGPRRKPGRAWDLGSSEDRRYADIAATLQSVTEAALLGLCRAARASTGTDALCLAGGVALNAVANGRILRESGFSRVFVQPAAGDAGGALGAALIGAIEAGDPRPAPFQGVALGERVNLSDALELAAHLGIRVQELADPAQAIGELLLKDQVVGLCTGRFEWGPRALGQRSLLALPRDRTMSDYINHMIKQREQFRPFAPAVLESRASEFFEYAPNDMTPYMTSVCPVRPEAREKLAAVVHVDGTARVQSVRPEITPLLAQVASVVGDATGIPVVLNTSLNGPGEPIVASAGDALAFLLAHPVDALVIENQLFRKQVRA